MFSLISVFVIIICVFLTLIVLVQNSKGGGLASNFSSHNQMMGVKKTSDFLEKATWYLAVALVVLSITSTAFIPRNEGSTLISDDKIMELQDENTTPTFPVATPPAQEEGGADAE